VTIPFTRNIYSDAEDFRLQDSKDYFRLAPGKTVGLFQAPYPITCTAYRTDPSSGDVVELICRLEDGKDSAVPKKPKAFIQWVAKHDASGSPLRIDETRIFHPLFRSDNPAALPDFKDDVNPDSLEVVKGALMEVGFWSVAKKAIADAREEERIRTQKALSHGAVTIPAEVETLKPASEQLFGNEVVRFQGLRVAYFTLDKDARLACLEEDTTTPGRREGDLLVLNRIVSLKEDSGKAF
jgi:glutaminyl-tRNA synthetase